MPRTARETLSDAVARNAAMVLSLPSAGMMRHNKSRFLNDNENGIWIEAVLSELPLIASLIENAQPCAISFKTGDQKVSFVAKPLRFEPQYKINSENEPSRAAGRMASGCEGGAAPKSLSRCDSSRQ